MIEELTKLLQNITHPCDINLTVNGKDIRFTTSINNTDRDFLTSLTVPHNVFVQIYHGKKSQDFYPFFYENRTAFVDAVLNWIVTR